MCDDNKKYRTWIIPGRNPPCMSITFDNPQTKSEVEQRVEMCCEGAQGFDEEQPMSLHEEVEVTFTVLISGHCKRDVDFAKALVKKQLDNVADNNGDTMAMHKWGVKITPISA